MKVELSIRDDRELRNHIKDVIKGEITSIARGEIDNILDRVMNQRFPDGKIMSMIEKAINDKVSRAIGQGSYSWQKNIMDIVREQVSKMVTVTLKDK